MLSPFNTQPMVRYGVEFSQSWLDSIGLTKIPDDVEKELNDLVDKMKDVMSRWEERRNQKTN